MRDKYGDWTYVQGKFVELVPVLVGKMHAKPDVGSLFVYPLGLILHPAQRRRRKALNNDGIVLNILAAPN